MELTAGQQEAVELVEKAKEAQGIAIIAGAAGTGKSTVVREFARGAMLLAPTGRAAARLRDVSGGYATTIHSWLYIPQVDKHNRLVGFMRRNSEDLLNNLRGDTLVVDEASMIYRDVFDDLIAVSRDLELGLIFVGDYFQLPPVCAKNETPFSIFDEGIKYELGDRYVGRVDLTQVMRQALDSPVLRAATKIRERGWGGLHDAVEELPRLRCSLSEHNAEQRRALGSKIDVATAPVIIAHRNATRLALNTRVHALLGHPADDLAAGEPLLIRKNQRRIGFANGELVPFEAWTGPARVGRSTQKTLRPTEFNKLLFRPEGDPFVYTVQATLAPDYVLGLVDIEPGYASRDCFGDEGAYLHAQLGYAITCHSAQGSEWPEVSVVIESSLKVLSPAERARWAYTALTRAKKTAEVAFLA